MANPRGTPENLLPGEVAPLKHQGHRWLNRGLAPLCGYCVLKDACPRYSDEPAATCELIEEAHEQLVSSIIRQPHIDAEIDLPLISEYVRSLLFLQLIDLWTSRAGIFVVTKQKGTGQQLVDTQPVFNTSYTVAGHAKRLAEALQLTPAARRDIEQGAGTLSRLLAAEVDDGDNA